MSTTANVIETPRDSRAQRIRVRGEELIGKVRRSSSKRESLPSCPTKCPT
jgi:hypothetical protein